MRFHGPKDVCAKLNIGDSTLRKWAGYLIKLGGYQFVVDQYGHRSYSDRDIAVLQRMQELLSRKYTYEDAVKEICNAENAHHAENGENPDDKSVLPVTHVPGVLPVPSDEMYKELISAIKKQTELNQTLVERLERLEARDQQWEERAEQRDSVLMQVLRELQESRMQVSAEQERKKKRWWYRRN